MPAHDDDIAATKSDDSLVSVMAECSYVLKIQGLRKSFCAPDGEWKQVVSVENFSMPAKARVGLRGESGCGKTTFLNLIAGILKPEAGSILINGTEISSLSESRRDRLRASTMGYVHQSFNLLQGYTCLENVLLAMSFGAGRDRAFAITLLKRVGLAHRLDFYPRQLSTGQQQRVAVARALANRPTLVLADEPTGNLDQMHAVEVMELLCRACDEQGAALLVASHDHDLLGRFTEVLDFNQLNEARG